MTLSTEPIIVNRLKSIAGKLNQALTMLHIGVTSDDVYATIQELDSDADYNGSDDELQGSWELTYRLVQEYTSIEDMSLFSELLTKKKDIAVFYNVWVELRALELHFNTYKFNNSHTPDDVLEHVQGMLYSNDWGSFLLKVKGL